MKENEIEIEKSVTTKPNLVDQALVDDIKEFFNKSMEEEQKNLPVFDPSAAYQGIGDYKDFTQPNIDQLRVEAEASYDEYEKKQKSEIENQYQKKLETLENKEQSAEENLLKAENELNLTLGNNMEKIAADTVQSGIANSSIAQNLKNELKSNIDSELEEAYKKASVELADIELKRGMALSEMEVALNKFDIAMASKIEQKINDLTKQYTYKKQEVEDYNKKVQEKRDAIYNQWKAEADETIRKVRNKAEGERLKYFLEKINKMSKREALDYLQQPEIAVGLGTWVNSAVDYINRVLR